MEIVVAALILLATVAFAVFLAVNIEKGREWAVEIARAVSMLDPVSVSHDLYERLPDRPVASRVDTPVAPESQDRLAA